MASEIESLLEYALNIGASDLIVTVGAFGSPFCGSRVLGS